MKAIPKGVFGRLYKLTSRTDKNMESTIDSLYPDRFSALSRANLTPEKIPKMKNVILEIKTKQPLKDNKKDNKNKDKRTTYFCIGFF